jgi:hypothetical protein
MDTICELAGRPVKFYNITCFDAPELYLKDAISLAFKQHPKNKRSQHTHSTLCSCTIMSESAFEANAAPKVYTIKVKNNFGQATNYFVFSETPLVKGAGSEIFQNALANSGLTPKGGTATFKFQEEYYAICGVTRGELKYGIVVGVDVPKGVNLSSGKPDGSHLQMKALQGEPKTADFEEKDATDCKETGAYIIDCDSDFTIQGM